MNVFTVRFDRRNQKSYIIQVIDTKWLITPDTKRIIYFSKIIKVQIIKCK